MNETATILNAIAEQQQDRDTAANKGIREVATTPSPEHIIPAEVVAFLYRHVDLMRAEFFGGDLPEIVLSFDVTDRRQLGHYVIRRNGVGIRWAVNLNPIHLARPVFEVLSTLLHEATHSWQHLHGSPSSPPYHNKEFRDRCAAFGVPTDAGGHDLGVRHGSPFEEYCRRHGVAFPPVPSAEPGGAPGPSTVPTPLLPAPPVKPSGSRLRKWQCPCGVNARVAISGFDATCNLCGGRFRLMG